MAPDSDEPSSAEGEPGPRDEAADATRFVTKSGSTGATSSSSTSPGTPFSGGPAAGILGGSGGEAAGGQRSAGSSTMAPGSLLSYTYRIERLLARGGMGEVYKAQHAELGTWHAIKVILPELADSPKIVDLFRREAGILRNVRNDAVVGYDGVFRDENGRVYLVMEYVDGTPLSDILKSRKLSPAEVRLLRDRIASGLAAAHETGVVHRDMSPDNVIIPEGRLDRAKIIDFGIAKLSDPQQATIIGEDFAGKYSYVSPEQLGMYGGVIDARSDIYSIGLILAAAAIGRPIDMGNSPMSVIEARRGLPDLSAVPDELLDELAIMLQPDPANRPQSMRALISGGGDKAPPAQAAGPEARPAATKPPQPAGRGKPAALWGGAALLLLAAAGGGAYFLLAPSDEAQQEATADPLQAEPASPQAPAVATAGPTIAASPETPTPAKPSPGPEAPAAATPAGQSASRPPAAAAPAASSPATPSPVAASPAAAPRPEGPVAQQASPLPATAVAPAPATAPASARPAEAVTPAVAPAPAPTVQAAAPERASPVQPAPPSGSVVAEEPPQASPTGEQLAAAGTTPAPIPDLAGQRRAIQRVIEEVRCGRAGGNLAGQGNERLRLVGHVPSTAERQILRTRLLGIPGVKEIDDSGLVTLPEPHCSVVETVATSGLSLAAEQQPPAGQLGVPGQAGTLLFHAGQLLTLDLTAPGYPVYYYVDYYDNAGNVIHLMPSPVAPSNRLQAKQALRIGGTDRYAISPPFGLDLVVAIGSSVPLFGAERAEVESAEAYLAELSSALTEARLKNPSFRGEYSYIFVETKP